MNRWHGSTQGTKTNIVYHLIMLAICILLLVLSVVGFIYVLINKGFYIEMLIGVLFILGSIYMHQFGLYESTIAYASTAQYKNAFQQPTIIDRLTVYLVNHYNKKWVPAKYMCCSFCYLDPRIAHDSFDFSLVRDYGKRRTYGTPQCRLYRCNKCRKYILAIESEEIQQSAYMPVKSPEDADEKRKDFDFYSIRTLRPILHGEEDFWTWENKEYTGDAD